MLETPRLRLRPLWQDDVDAYARWLADPVLMEHMGHGIRSWEESETALGRHLRRWEEHGLGLLAVEGRLAR